MSKISRENDSGASPSIPTPIITEKESGESNVINKQQKFSLDISDRLNISGISSELGVDADEGEEEEVGEESDADIVFVDKDLAVAEAKNYDPTVIDVPSTRERVKIIQDLFEDESDVRLKELINDLDEAMTVRTDVIIIEPIRLSECTERWITCGNGLHKYTVLTGLFGSFGVLIWPRQWMNVWAPLASTTAASYLFYRFGWQYDPCCQYQVERDPQRLGRLQLSRVRSNSILVVHRRDPRARIALHTTLTFFLCSAIGYRVYKEFYSSGSC